jgi:hypothetical protein
MASLPAIQSGVGSATGILAAVPQIAGLFGNSVAQTVGYQPQGQITTPSANILNTLNSTINSLFSSTPTLLFHYEGEQTVTFESDITDHWIEDNTSIQDQIALKPLIITTQGFIGELNNVPPNKALQALQTTANTLTNISGYAPGLSVTALEAYNEAFFAYQTAGNAAVAAQAAWGSISGGTSGESVISNGVITTQASNQNKQQTMFQQLYAYYQSRILFTIQTPWAVFQNCAIASIKANQDPDTQVISDFSCTFKQVRFINQLIPNNNSNAATGRLSAQSQAVVNNGSSTPSASSMSFGSAFSNLA